MNKILCAGNWESDVGYAWWLMERFWEGVALRYPGRVTVSYSRLRNVPERLSRAGVEFIEHDISRPLTPLVNRHGFAHVYLTDQPYYCAQYARLRRAGVKSIIVHDHSPGERPAVTGVKRLLKTAVARVAGPCAADAYIAVSDLVMRRFLETACLPVDRCHLAVNGIDLDIDIKPVDIRAELGIPADAIVAVSASRATRYKRVHHIIEAAAQVKDVYFIHCGDGPDLTYFDEQVAHFGLKKRFFLLGRRADVPGILASADIGVHASAGEVGTSLTIMEFARAGLPIVLPDSPSVAAGFEHGATALLYPPGSVADLAQRLCLLATSPAVRASLGEAARVRARRFNIEHTVEAVLGVFRALRI